jgi:hypothetical protein
VLSRKKFFLHYPLCIHLYITMAISTKIYILQLLLLIMRNFFFHYFSSLQYVTNVIGPDPSCYSMTPGKCFLYCTKVIRSSPYILPQSCIQLYWGNGYPPNKSFLLGFCCKSFHNYIHLLVPQIPLVFDVHSNLSKLAIYQVL